MTEPGLYEGKIIAHGLVKSGNKGTPGLDVRCEVAIPALTDQQPEAVGSAPWDVASAPAPAPARKVVTTTLWLSPAAIKRSKSILGGLGFSGRIMTLDPRSHGHVSLAGTLVNLKCEVETYEGTEREKWEIAAGGNEPLPLEEFAAIDSRFAGEFDASDEVPY